jgi:hypothetical protein
MIYQTLFLDLQMIKKHRVVYSKEAGHNLHPIV